MIIEVQGSSAEPYKVNTEEVTCTCRDFVYRRAHYSIENPDRLCKHLLRVYSEHPEIKPASIMNKKVEEQSGVDPDGKTRYPRSTFDPYISDLRSLMKTFNSDVRQYEFCGSYRRLKSRVSDIDLLFVLNDGKNVEGLFDYCENVLGYKKLWRGDIKASYLIDGFVQVDFKSVPLDSWPFALLHYTGSKDNNIRMRRLAMDRDLSLSEYGLKDKDGNLIPDKFTTEKDIFDFLGTKYLEPNER
jgi:DNA polymerase/3'-5' exonuclease PolX